MFTTHLCFAKVALGLALVSCAAASVAQPAATTATLLAKHAELRTLLLESKFGEPLYLVSQERPGRLEGDVYAELPLPFSRVSAVLRSGESVCGLLFLHLNIRSCQPAPSANAELLTLSVGPKVAVAGATNYSMAYTMHVDAATTDYLRVALAATNGPLFTHDYNITFEAIPLPGQRTFLHFFYGYSFGTMAKMAVGAYLATAGSSKIGFTVIGQQPNGQPRYVQGERGSLERNVIRNYLALLAYAGTNTGTPRAQTDARLRAWFALTERHAPQLHELDLNAYLQQKNADLDRMAK